MDYEQSCGIVPFRRFAGQKQFLLLHSVLVRNPDAAWEFPKGSPDPGESEVEAALRELREETGVTKISILPDFRDEVSYLYRRDGRPISKRVTFFTGEVTEWSNMPVQAPTREHGPHPAEACWFTWAAEPEAQARLFHPGMRKLLNRCALFIYEYDRIQKQR